MKKKEKAKQIKKRVYRLCWNYIKESKNYIFIILGLFIISGIIGLIFPVFFTDYIKQMLEKIISQTSGLNIIELFIFIFRNNLIASISGLILGIFFGIYPLLICIINGYVLGFVANKSIISSGILVLWRLLPHGIFELPAVIISLGLGLRLGMWIFVKNKGEYFKYNFLNSLKVFVYVIIPLLLIAGIIETILIYIVG